ncbi:MAG: hypothetical protein K6C99_06760 [Lachnospiraceae bacterium]|nr:hypothetical protein [Lachnospiraceae bacterium]
MIKERSRTQMYEFLIENPWIFPVLNILKIVVVVAILVIIGVVLAKARKKRREKTKEAIHQMLNPEDDRNK